MEETVTCELEAAEILAGLSRSSAAAIAESEPTSQIGAVTSSLNPQVQKTVYAHTTIIANAEKNNLFPQTTEKPVPSHFCSKSCRSNPVGKTRSKLTETEKEERRIRRVLANRESARQSIRRRQAMYLDLRRKAADVSEENESLKKEKELALRDYTSLRERNEFLKAEISKINKAKQGGETRELEISSSASADTWTISSSNKQPSPIPFIWPSVVPCSDVFQFQHAFNNITGSSHVDKSCSHIKGQEHQSMGVATGTGVPVFIVPVPWLLPYLSQNNTMPHSRSCNEEAQSSHHCSMSASLDVRHGGDKTRLPSNKYVQHPGFDCTKTMPGFSDNGPFNGERSLGKNVRFATRNFQVDENSGINFVSPSENRSLPQKSTRELVICPNKNSENASSATKVRRRRKELMKMKDIRFHCTNTR